MHCYLKSVVSKASCQVLSKCTISAMGGALVDFAKTVRAVLSMLEEGTRVEPRKVRLTH